MTQPKYAPSCQRCGRNTISSNEAEKSLVTVQHSRYTWDGKVAGQAFSYTFCEDCAQDFQHFLNSSR